MNVSNKLLIKGSSMSIMQHNENSFVWQ